MSLIEFDEASETVFLVSVNYLDKDHLIGAFGSRADAVAYCKKHDELMLSDDKWVITRCALNFE